MIEVTSLILVPYSPVVTPHLFFFVVGLVLALGIGPLIYLFEKRRRRRHRKRRRITLTGRPA